MIKNILKPFIGVFSTQKMACGYNAAKWLYGENIDNVILLKNAIDSDKFKFNIGVRNTLRGQLGVSNKIVFGHVGHFERQKNHEYLIDVFNLIRKEKYNAVLLLLGDGSLENSIKQKVDELALNDSIIFVGTVKDVSPYLQAMDIFIFPSLFEGFSLALTEAQCSGLKCFVSENIPPEINFTGLVNFLPISDSPTVWSNCILSDMQYKREDMSYVVEENGLSIKNVSIFLQDFYLRQL